MCDWKDITLQEVVSKLSDGLHGTPSYDEDGEYFFINGNNLSNGKILIKNSTKKTSIQEFNKYKKDLNLRTVLISINGTLGNVSVYNNEKCILGKSVCYFNVLNNVDKMFMIYIVKNKHFQKYINVFANGTTIKNVSLKVLREYPFSLPPLPEQKAIADVLSSLDDKIDLLHRQNETLEALAQTLFRYWFIEEPEDDWEEGILSDFADVIDCLHSKKPDQLDFSMNAKYLLQVFNISNNGNIDLKEKYYVSDEDYREWTKRIELKGGDLIITKTGRVGAIAQIPDDLITGIGRNLVAIRAKKPYSSEFLKDLLMSKWMERKIKLNTSDGTILQSLHVKSIASLPAINPGGELIKKYSSMIQPFHKKIMLNNKSIETLEKLRDTLLPKLISGQVRVRF
jgi:type I restriction enzyme, S subunit